MKLELKHLAPYLPYGLKIQYLLNETLELVGFNKNTIFHTRGFFVELPCNLKPILRPLSDLTKEIEHNGERFVPVEKLEEMYGLTVETQEDKVLTLPITLEPYYLIRQLFEWHFDIFNLIENNLAIDINTLTDKI